MALDDSSQRFASALLFESLEASSRRHLLALTMTINRSSANVMKLALIAAATWINCPCFTHIWPLIPFGEKPEILLPFRLLRGPACLSCEKDSPFKSQLSRQMCMWDICSKGPIPIRARHLPFGGPSHLRPSRSAISTFSYRVSCSARLSCSAGGPSRQMMAASGMSASSISSISLKSSAGLTASSPPCRA